MEHMRAVLEDICPRCNEPYYPGIRTRDMTGITCPSCDGRLSVGMREKIRKIYLKLNEWVKQ